jgi:host factor-I protein
MVKSTINIQDGFLFQALKATKPVSIHLITGERLVGQLKRFDRFALVIETNDQEVLVYKHGVVSVETDRGEE